MMNDSFYGSYRNRKFSDIWQNDSSFVIDYTNSGLSGAIDNPSATTLYYLLYSRYGNSVIASSDENRFKYNVYSIIWQYGPNWVKKLDLQNKLRGMSEEELTSGNKQIFNNAENPSVEPGTYDDIELKYINSQNVTKSKRGKLEAYSILSELLADDVTESFIVKFKKLFLTIVEPERPLWYEGESEDDCLY